jgi:hypothetical protein
VRKVYLKALKLIAKQQKDRSAAGDGENNG